MDESRTVQFHQSRRIKVSWNVTDPDAGHIVIFGNLALDGETAGPTLFTCTEEPAKGSFTIPGSVLERAGVWSGRFNEFYLRVGLTVSKRLSIPGLDFAEFIVPGPWQMAVTNLGLLLPPGARPSDENPARLYFSRGEPALLAFDYAGKEASDERLRSMTCQPDNEGVPYTTVSEAVTGIARNIILAILLNRGSQFSRLTQHVQPRALRAELRIIERRPFLVFAEARFFHLTQ